MHKSEANYHAMLKLLLEITVLLMQFLTDSTVDLQIVPRFDSLISFDSATLENIW